MTLRAMPPAGTTSEDGTGAGEHVGLPWYVLDDYRCFGCSPHNPHGIQLRFTEDGTGPEAQLRTGFSLGREHESYPGVVHGGLLGVICDETMGNLIVLRTGLVAFTTSMRMRYVGVVLVDERYECVARMSEGGGEFINARAEILDGAGDLVAGASATYQPVPLDAATDRIALGSPQTDRLRRALADAADRRQI